YAAYIIIIGLIWGNVVGLGICVLQEQFELIRLSEENYYLSVAPIELHFWTIVSINVGTLILTILFLVVPSYLVTSISPVKAIRFK
ncbi:MAG: ABC transporter permease, partial [Saprospiraceae bacterium]|nr:ABC transporter permease [Saprospiraceae bacterium]